MHALCHIWLFSNILLLQSSQHSVEANKNNLQIVDKI